VALQVAASKPELVRRLVLLGIPCADRLPAVAQQALLMRTGRETAEELGKAKAAVPHARVVDLQDFTDDAFDAAPKTLALQIGAFLSGRP